MKTEVVAPAKVNLSLEVRGRRKDGFHELRSLAVAVSLRDRLVVRWKRPLSGGHGSSSSLHVTFAPGLFFPPRQRLRAAELFSGPRHSLASAWRWWKKNRGEIPGRWDVEVEKNIPLAAGLGGGTADAAAFLKVLADWIQGPLPSGDFVEELGSDMAFCLHGGPGWILGRGERVEPARLWKPLALCLLKPPGEMASKNAYAALDVGPCPSGRQKPPSSGLISLEDVWEKGGSPFWAPAVEDHPEIETLAHDLRVQEAQYVSITGSGPTLFGVFSSLTEARRAARVFRERGHWSCAVTVF
jgi:4-diphosphocytidyl-2-C-methyl-D-erythritol kinase